MYTSRILKNHNLHTSVLKVLCLFAWYVKPLYENTVKPNYLKLEVFKEFEIKMIYI